MTLKRFLVTLILLTVPLFSPNALAVDKQMSSAMKSKMRSTCSATDERGHWQLAEATPDARRSLNMVLYQMNADDKLKAIHEVRTKMVGGTHYAFEFELQDGQVWNAIVLHSARGDYMIERHAKKGELCPKDGNS
ncbi:cystatin [Vibrio alginolyticus]|uniref:cystatin n=1 Tax=Vibrio TaxID=662 RepID=UPI001EB71F9C|nr:MULTISPECIES: cystatin [Vibrio]EGQ9215378.1 cystatin [Vibrio alginolyticus]EJL6733026.1 cystatin [Vibrio alginolyticus]ELA6791051.1 cystatin [Vibrio alginolyticus]ELA8374881.1 cystatin [Vibrio alginolyticus]ELB2816089.1 cystatin [Vibrio alginolyticus]